MDQEHQRNKPNKGHSEKIELNNKRELRREGTVLNNKHIRKNIPTLYNRWTKGVYTQPPPHNYTWQQQTLPLKAADSISESNRLYIWQQQTTRGYDKILYLSSFWRMLGGCNRGSFQFFEQLKFKTLQLFVPNSKRLGGYTQWVPFFQKSAHHSKEFFKTRVVKQCRIQDPLTFCSK